MLNKRSPRGLDCAGRDSIVVAFGFGSFSPLLLVGICFEVGLGVSFPSLRSQQTPPKKQDSVFVGHD